MSDKMSDKVNKCIKEFTAGKCSSTDVVTHCRPVKLVPRNSPNNPNNPNKFPQADESCVAEVENHCGPLGPGGPGGGPKSKSFFKTTGGVITIGVGVVVLIALIVGGVYIAKKRRW